MPYLLRYPYKLCLIKSGLNYLTFWKLNFFKCGFTTNMTRRKQYRNDQNQTSLSLENENIFNIIDQIKVSLMNRTVSVTSGNPHAKMAMPDSQRLPLKHLSSLKCGRYCCFSKYKSIYFYCHMFSCNIKGSKSLWRETTIENNQYLKL